ncbi:leucine Rich Repeat family protein [Aphelenchoides avenae]|nr:leucine Rich Repeat family protein [Aphelenchus avenae]
MGNQQPSQARPAGPAVTTKLSAFSLKSGPSSATVTRHLDNAKKSRILQLKGCHLKVVPNVLEEVADILRNLDLSQNRIKEVPPFIGNFNALKQLHLSVNLIDRLPDEIGFLKSLETLSINGNQLTELPESLTQLSSLKTLNASANRLSRFPTVVCQLTQLEVLDLSENQIESIPDEISNLRAAELNLNRNRLNAISPRLAKCARLKVLRVEENCLASTVFTKEILKDSQLSLIAYAGNLFAEKDFQGLPGYDDYQDRFTATKRKGV